MNVGVLYGFWVGGLFGWVLWYPVVGVALGLQVRRQAVPSPGRV